VTCTGTEPLEVHGTVTFRVVALPPVTVAATPPMLTALEPGVALKLMPVRVAAAPGTSGDGDTEVTCGAAEASVPGGVSVATYSVNAKVVTVAGMFSCQFLAVETSAVDSTPSAPSSPWSTPPMLPPYWK